MDKRRGMHPFTLPCMVQSSYIGCGNSSDNYTLNRCNTLSMESQLQGKRLRWLGHVFRMPKKLLVKSWGFAHLAALGLVSMLLHCVIVRTVELVDVVEMLTALERKDLSRTYLARHELESVFIVYIVIIVYADTHSHSRHCLLCITRCIKFSYTF